jgi:hypothetical protein
MKNLNIGVINLVVSNQLKESYFNNNSLNEAKKATSELLNVVKNSPILQLEFKVFNNLENKEINDDTLAPRYIDNNIKLFEIYTIDELQNEHKKLEPFIKNKKIVENDRTKLYNSIDLLIEESLKPSDEINVDGIHESFSVVLDHIKKPKQINENNDINNINENVIEIAINKFNEKYENMSLDEARLFRKLINSDNNKKKQIFEEYKNQNKKLLESLSEEKNNEKISQSLEKINNMEYNPDQADNDIIKLFELKQGLK